MIQLNRNRNQEEAGSMGSENKTVVITGGTSGLGLAMAKRFKHAGYTVVIVSRNERENLPCDRFYSCDLTDPNARKDIVKRIAEDNFNIHVWINNAGIGVYALCEELSDKNLRKIMELNYFAPVDLSMQVLDILKKNNGSLVQICSVASQMPLCCMSTYSSSKSALLMFNESLRMETDVHLVSVLPGRIDTGFSSRAVKVREVPNTPGNRSTSPDKLAEKVFNAVKKRKSMVVYPFWYRYVIFFSRLCPGITRSVSRKIWNLGK